MSNTVKDHSGNDTGVYVSDIHYYADEYINSLKDTDSIYTPNSNQFTGMIKYINRNMRFTRDIYADINLLNDIWDIYTDLVYKYNQKPTIEEYCLLIGISRETIYSWLRGEYRNDDICEKLGTSRSDTVKKWQEECKLGRYKGAASGNVGMIFLCKAVDGMVETAPIGVMNEQQKRALPDAELPQLGSRKPLELTDKTQDVEDVT